MKGLLLREKYRIALLVILLFLFGALNTQGFLQRDKKELVPSPMPTQTPTPIESGPTVTPIASITPFISQAPKKPSPRPTSSSSNTLSVQSFYYPEAIIESSGLISAKFVSKDDAGEITDWYAAKFNELGLTSKTTVRTSTNGNVKNKLSGSKGGATVSVDIEKSANSLEATITVSIH